MTRVVFTSGPLSSAGASIKGADEGALSVAAFDSNSVQKQDVKDAKINLVTPALKMVRELRVEPQYEQKARNMMHKILDNPNVIKRNDQGELVLNGVDEPTKNFNALCFSMVKWVHDLLQPGIDTFLGAVRKLEVKSNELTGQSLQRMYSSTPAHVRISEITPRPRKHQPEFIYEDPGESDIELEYAYSQFHHIKTTPAKTKRKNQRSTTQQTCFGLRKMSVLPPGQKPKIPFVY